jgi:acyl-CoA reductase-like NAD-dependent aldehyde dehydrogenase
MPLSMSADAVEARREAARHAIQARWSRTTPEERRAATRKMRISSALRVITDAADDLTEDQKDRLFEALYGPDAA